MRYCECGITNSVIIGTTNATTNAFTAPPVPIAAAIATTTTTRPRLPSRTGPGNEDEDEEEKEQNEEAGNDRGGRDDNDESTAAVFNPMDSKCLCHEGTCFKLNGLQLYC